MPTTIAVTSVTLLLAVGLLWALLFRAPAAEVIHTGGAASADGGTIKTPVATSPNKDGAAGAPQIHGTPTGGIDPNQ